jgi:hypothetical protein
MKPATAPSIPAVSQSWGYEETKTGNLVLQRGPKADEGHTGKGVDLPGPGSYNPDKVTPKTTGAGFGKSRSRRVDFTMKTAASDIGPGYYFQEGRGDLANAVSPALTAAKKASSVFVSKTNRDSLGPSFKAALDTPAPGSYSLKSQFEK